jgi:hypothetical protein
LQHRAGKQEASGGIKNGIVQQLQALPVRRGTTIGENKKSWNV